MERAQVELPKRVAFSTAIPVRVTDLNYGAHVGNDSILSITHEVRMQFLGSLGATEGDVGDGTALIMAYASIAYRSECFYGDVIEADVGVDDIGSRGFDLVTVMRSRNTANEIARIAVGMRGFNSSKRSIRELPAAFLQLLRGAAQE